ncbi:uncharacterized protein FA14DRAFT_179197 [Meira miltonrushii]|uniref:N-acetyl-D-glucosamine kinase n=1 Tax=Meira miltonrushii TaxID=1280837 RepID=A0A316VDW0_9BASI|nr:uncharacterized protein FA14DRAFT_179197 [Meira miltonrushii]PWN35829.1 hypothetical protein FA14DRAFT_179197 [Meira miltonrushii]
MNMRPWPPRLYLAIDCGGTKAAAAICNEQGEIVGRGQGGPANYTDIGLLPFLASVEDAVKIALEGARLFYAELNDQIQWQILDQQSTSTDSIHSSFHRQIDDEEEDDDGRKSTHSALTIADALASIKPNSLTHHTPSPSIQAAWLGIAGVDSPADVTTLSPHLATLFSIPHPSNRLIVANDTSLLASPIADSLRPEIKSGVVAIAGTGSIVMSFRRKRNGMLGVLGRVGGFGWLIGDEGSGYSVGRTAVRSVLDLTDHERLRMEDERSMMNAEEEEDSELDEDDAREDGSTQIEDTATTFEMDMTRRMSKDGEITLPSTPPRGHLLRDRILQHWGLISTDELLRAVYFDDAQCGQPNGRGVPAAASNPSKQCVAPVTDRVDQLSKTESTLRDDIQSTLTKRFNVAQIEKNNSTDSNLSRKLTLLPTRTARTSSSSMTDEPPSASLLPPTVHTLDVETRLRGVSPIPSLSSSPGSRSSNTFSDVANSSTAPSPAFTRENSTSRCGQTRMSQDEPLRTTAELSSGLATEITSASSSLSMSAGRHGIEPVSVHRRKETEEEKGEKSNGCGSMSTSNASTGSAEGKHPRSTLERKHRLASLAPLVFHLAFTHNDAESLEILRTQAHFMAKQIEKICKVDRTARAYLNVKNSVLCLGGSLVGVKNYRELLVEQLASLGIVFARVEFVGDPAKRGAIALSHVMERAREEK